MGVVNLRGCVEFRGIGRANMAAHAEITLPPCHRLLKPNLFLTRLARLLPSYIGGILLACDKILLSVAKQHRY